VGTAEQRLADISLRREARTPASLDMENWRNSYREFA
jgi:hypothetical protein